MIHRTWLTVLFATLVVSASRAQSPQEEPVAQVVRPMSYQDPGLPDVMRKEEFSQYMEMLGLSPEQQHAIQQPWLAYCGHANEFVRDVLNPLWKRAGEMPRLGPIERAGALPALCDDRDKAVAGLTSREAMLFDAISLVLAEPQFPRLEQVRLERKRVLHQWVTQGSVRDARPDLFACVRALQLNEEPAALQPVMIEYREALTPRLVELARHSSKTSAEVATLMAEFELARQQGGAEATAKAVFERRKQLTREGVVKRKRIGEINRGYLQRMLDTLAPEDSRRLEAQFLATAYPEAYPDVGSQSLCDTFFRLKELDLSEEQEAAIAALNTQYETAYRALAERVHKKIDELEELLAEGQVMAAELQALRDSRDRLIAERTELNGRARQQVEALLTPEQTSALKPSQVSKPSNH